MTEIQYDHEIASLLGPAHYEASSMWAFRNDSVASMGFDDIGKLMRSPDWEDRVRARVLMRNLDPTLPDDFPCIYETADSPNLNRDAPPRRYTPQNHAWVVSADIDMLAAVLEDYQALWDGYTGQWGPWSRRTFALGRLNGVSASRVLMPGATPDDVLIQTIATHSMYPYAPEHIKEIYDKRYKRLRK